MDTADLEKRFTYHKIDAEDQVYANTIRSKGSRLALFMDIGCPDSRELSLAITHLEDAVMWANKAIAQKGK